MDGFLLVHGKQSGPELESCALNMVYEFLSEQGYPVDYVSYSWSRDRQYDVTSYQSAEEMHQGINRLKEQGATRIHVLGHSLGGNMALYYSTLDYQDYDSLIVLCPAHNLHNFRFQSLVDWSAEKATKLIEEGNDSPAQFLEFHMGRAVIVDMVPSIYKSFFDKTGPCNMVKSVANTKTAKPVYMIVGSDDMLTINTKELLFDPMLKDPVQSKFENLEGESHVSVPASALPGILTWTAELTI